MSEEHKIQIIKLLNHDSLSKRQEGLALAKSSGPLSALHASSCRRKGFDRKSPPSPTLDVLLFGILILAFAFITEPASAQEARPVSPRHISVLFDESFDLAAPGLAWTVTSPNDPSWSGDALSATGYRSRPVDMSPVGWPFPTTLEHELFVELTSPMNPGYSYVVASNDGQATVSLNLGSAPLLTPAIHLNQEGYIPGVGMHYAYVSHWMGTLGPMELKADELSFLVRDASTHEQVYSGQLNLRRAADSSEPEDVYGQEYTHTNVYQADLSDLTEPGAYYIELSGVARSHDFEVGPDVLDFAFKTTFRALYHQRCGMELSSEYTDWTHGLCHQDPVHLTTTDYQISNADAFDDLPNGATGETIQVTGGYHDAGDYDRRITHLVVVDDLVSLFEIDPVRFAWDSAGIPESGNGVPDVLDEALWALGLYRKMQRNDGAVSAGVETTGYPDWGVMPENDAHPDGQPWVWYAYDYDPVSTMRFAAAAAKLSRALVGIDDEQAAQLLSEAQAAWNWAIAEGPRETYGDNVKLRYRVHGAQAAAELLATTGEPAYHDAFAELGPFTGGNLSYSLYDWDAAVWLDGLFTYARAEAADPEYASAAERVIVERAEVLLEVAEKTAFRLVKHPYGPIRMSGGSTPTREGPGVLIRAHVLTGRVEFRDWAVAACDLTLGGNPAGWSWVTGVGDKPVREPLHMPSMGDGIDDPVPGITVYGPNDAVENGGILGAALIGYHPHISEWPQLERYADVGYPPGTNEFTVYESIGPSLFAFGYFAELAEEAEETGDIKKKPTSCACSSGAGHRGLTLLLAVGLAVAWRRKPQIG